MPSSQRLIEVYLNAVFAAGAYVADGQVASVLVMCLAYGEIGLWLAQVDTVYVIARI